MVDVFSRDDELDQFDGVSALETFVFHEAAHAAGTNAHPGPATGGAAAAGTGTAATSTAVVISPLHDAAARGALARLAELLREGSGLTAVPIHVPQGKGLEGRTTAAPAPVMPKTTAPPGTKANEKKKDDDDADADDDADDATDAAAGSTSGGAGGAGAGAGAGGGRGGAPPPVPPRVRSAAAVLEAVEGAALAEMLAACDRIAVLNGPHAPRGDDGFRIVERLDQDVLDSTDAMDNTPLHWAAGAGQTAAVRLLVRLGASVNKQNQIGDTPLHRAVWRGHLGCVTVLLEGGANVSLRNREGQIPLNLVRAEHARIGAVIATHPTAADADGLTINWSPSGSDDEGEDTEDYSTTDDDDEEEEEEEGGKRKVDGAEEEERGDSSAAAAAAAASGKDEEA